MVKCMKYLSENKIENKMVLLRCDFNVPVKNGKITDNGKIIKSLKTIKYLLNNNNKVILLSHFGRVKSEDDKKNNSLKLVYQELKKHINLVFIENNENIEFYLNNSKSNCFLLENTRFTDVPEKRESKNNLELAKYWASFCDVFVLDAFGSMHRAHSSTAGIGAFLPTYLGFLVEEELEGLKDLLDVKEKFVVIMGGAKVDDKILIIENMLKKCDKLVLTGGILNTFLFVLGKNIGNSLVSKDELVLNNVKDLLKKYSDKLIYSENVVTNNGLKNIDDVCDGEIIYDNIVDLRDLLYKDSTVFFNGTCGKYEEEQYSIGTKKLLNDLKISGACIYIGGGDTVSAVKNFGYDKDFKFLSSGGGATLEYVSTSKLNAIEWIKEHDNEF